jgi:hypothetical protein
MRSYERRPGAGSKRSLRPECMWRGNEQPDRVPGEATGPRCRPWFPWGGRRREPGESRGFSLEGQIAPDPNGLIRPGGSLSLAARGLTCYGTLEGIMPPLLAGTTPGEHTRRLDDVFLAGVFSFFGLIGRSHSAVIDLGMSDRRARCVQRTRSLSSMLRSNFAGDQLTRPSTISLANRAGRRRDQQSACVESPSNGVTPRPCTPSRSSPHPERSRASHAPHSRVAATACPCTPSGAPYSAPAWQALK